MARLHLVDPDDHDADPKARQLLGLVRGSLERSDTLPWTDINVYRAMANHPEALQGILSFGAAAYQGNSLTPAQRELAYLGASVANDCDY